MYRLIKHQKAAGTRPTVIALLRHGKTLWNEEGRIQGLQDSPLSKSGRAQVEQWASFLCDYQIDQIIASDLGRVRETVNILQCSCPMAPVHWEPALREQYWGRWQGRTFKELKKTEGENLEKQIRVGWDFRPPQGESRREVLQRSLPVILNILQQFPGQRILVVCHEGIIKSILYHLAGRAFLPKEKRLLKKRQMHLLIGKGDVLQLGPLNILPPDLGFDKS